MKRIALLVAIAALATVSCADEVGVARAPGVLADGGDAGSTSDGGPEGGSSDFGTADLGSTDSGSVDSGTGDFGLVDSGSDSGPETGPADFGPGMPDSAPPDMTSPDAATPDASVPDFGMPDAGSADSSPSDGGSPAPDSGTPDASMPDTSLLDSAPSDSGPFDSGATDMAPADTGTATDAAEAGRDIGPACARHSDCSDGDSCTTDTCFAGSCTSVRIAGCGCMTDADCDDGNVCTRDVCVARACDYMPVACDGGVDVGLPDTGPVDAGGCTGVCGDGCCRDPERCYDPGRYSHANPPPAGSAQCLDCGPCMCTRDPPSRMPPGTVLNGGYSESLTGLIRAARIRGTRKLCKVLGGGSIGIDLSFDRMTDGTPDMPEHDGATCTTSTADTATVEATLSICSLAATFGGSLTREWTEQRCRECNLDTQAYECSDVRSTERNVGVSLYRRSAFEIGLGDEEAIVVPRAVRWLGGFSLGVETGVTGEVHAGLQGSYRSFEPGSGWCADERDCYSAEIGPTIGFGAGVFVRATFGPMRFAGSVDSTFDARLNASRSWGACSEPARSCLVYEVDTAVTGNINVERRVGGGPIFNGPNAPPFELGASLYRWICETHNDAGEGCLPIELGGGELPEGSDYTEVECREYWSPLAGRGGCTPRTCGQLGKQCGSHEDGCGGVVHCCPSGVDCSVENEGCPARSECRYEGRCIPCGGSDEPCCNDGTTLCDTGLVCDAHVTSDGVRVAYCRQCGSGGRPCCPSDLAAPGADTTPPDGCSDHEMSPYGVPRGLSCDRSAGGFGTCRSCGSEGIACCTSGEPCRPGSQGRLECTPGSSGERCAQCGERNEQCCPIGDPCGDHLDCTSDNRCRPCGRPYEICCPGNVCDPGAECGMTTTGPSCRPGGCGGRDQPCCETMGTMPLCDSGLQCTRYSFGNICRTCGGLIEPCCDEGMDCRGRGTYCDESVMPGQCRICGGTRGGPCCPDGTCTGYSQQCESGVCVDCGHDGQSCCADTSVHAPEGCFLSMCIGGTCRTCGDEGQMCCPRPPSIDSDGDGCNHDFSVRCGTGGECVSRCGRRGQRCCAAGDAAGPAPGDTMPRDGCTDYLFPGSSGANVCSAGQCQALFP